MRYVAGKGMKIDESVHVILEGGPEDGRTMRYDWELPYTIQIEGSWTPVDALNAHLDEYVNTGRLDDEDRVIYKFRRQRYTAEGGMWKAV